MAQIQDIKVTTWERSHSCRGTPFYRKYRYPNGKWNIYNQLGNNYLYTLNFDNALYYFNKALNLKTDQIDKASILNNIALTYMEQQEYHKAIQILSFSSRKKF
jgi:tetratricopeptide (TPR) repeat protein